MLAAVRAAGLALLRRWWVRAALVGLTPPWLGAAPAEAAPEAPPAPADPGVWLTQALCSAQRAAERLLRFPPGECADITLALPVGGWLMQITPATALWAALGVAVLWWLAKRDWAGAADSVAGRVAWETARAAGLAWAMKLAASALVGMARDAGAAAGG